MENRLALLDEIREIENKRVNLEYVLKQIKSYYIKNVVIETHIQSTDFQFDGDRNLNVDLDLFKEYLNKEIVQCCEKYITLIDRLK